MRRLQLRHAWPVRVLALVAAWAAVAPPVGAANREHLQMMAEIRMLQEQAQQLQQTLAALADTLKAVNARLDTQAEASRKAFADQRLLSTSTANDLRVLREKIDDNSVRLASLSQEVEALRTALPTLPAPAPAVPADAVPMPGAGAPATPPAAGTQAGAGAAPPLQPASPPPAAPPAATGMSPQRLFETAYADYAAGQWALAIQGFEAFIRTFPRSEQADEAQLYVGEALQLDGKFEPAVAAYDQVIANYPTGDQVPLAYYKRGLALMRLGRNDAARESWEAVIKRYPDADAAVLAKQGLDRLARPRR